MAMASGSNVYIPEELLWQILLFLPVESLLRCRSVCKSWLCWIDSSDFVKQHHRRRQDDRIVVYTCDPKWESPPLPRSPRLSLFSNYHNLCTELYLPGSSFSAGIWFDCFGMIYFDGIVCIYYLDEQYAYSDDNFRVYMPVMYIYLWNPATATYRSLPPPDFRLPVTYFFEEVDVSVGFGFDVKTNAYKVVRVVVWYHCRDGFLQSTVVEVYDLCTDSWRTLDLQLPVEAIISNLNEPLSNGRICCWLGRKKRRDQLSYTLLWFDFYNHELGTIPFPDRIRCHRRLELTIIRDNIASICYLEKGGIEVWMMNEFGIKESWTNIYVAVPFCERMLSIFNDCESFLLVWNSRLYIYNSVSETMKHLPLRNDFFGRIIIKDVRYKESLVSIEGGSDATNTMSRPLAQATQAST